MELSETPTWQFSELKIILCVRLECKKVKDFMCIVSDVPNVVCSQDLDHLVGLLSFPDVLLRYAE